jgi:hypothetical protein
MLDNIAKTFEQASVFQKLWTDSFTNMAGAMSHFSPSSPPLEEASKMRASMLKVLADTWGEFMQTPQFMETMKVSLNGMLDLRRSTREGMNKLHEQFEIPSKDDIDGVLLALRHVERRVLDRIEGLDERLAKFNERIERLEELSKPHEPPPQKRTMAVKQSRAVVSSRKRATVTSRRRTATAKAKREPTARNARQA